jgi:glycosyltransferase involved in cell wall biosynthesis
MRIGIDASRALTAQRTGTEAYALHLINSLLPLARAAGHQITLYFNAAGPDWNNPFAHHDWVTVRNIPRARLWTHTRLASALANDQPDVFFTPAHVIPWSYRGPAVATIHDLGYRHFPDAHPTRQRLYLEWSTRHNARRGRLVIADSQATRADLVRFYGIEEEKIAVIYPGPTPGLTPVTGANALRDVTRKYGFREPYFLFLSTLQPRKNVVRLIGAYDRYVADATAPLQRLVLAGKMGWRADPIIAALSALPYPNYATIHTPGYVAEEDKAALLSGATALLYPSLYEGFGFPVLEAQQCGTPVLTARNSSLAEVAGEGALYVDAHSTRAIQEGMERLAADDALRSRLRKAGFANAQRFSWQQTARETLALLTRAASEA